ncbi:unnamed protein product [Dimorphilus gyrociliatus]|uniref:Fucosyltransferase n=1 Tax=Dimorphilus gyrociliatus TaxID=2664684 RepID=A0A7I8W8Y9_9ANNE|nr:unnamed protein product [Dimorphilus gyrociliatus]
MKRKIAKTVVFCGLVWIILVFLVTNYEDGKVTNIFIWSTNEITNNEVMRDCILTQDIERAQVIVTNLKDLNSFINSAKNIKDKEKFLYSDFPPNKSLDRELIDNHFDWLISYVKESDIVIKQFKRTFFIHSNEADERAFDSEFASRTRLIFWMKEDCHQSLTTERIENYIELLSRFIPVDILSKCDNSLFPDAEKLYKYQFIPSNSNCRGYANPTVIKALSNGLIPVVYGVEQSKSNILPENSTLFIPQSTSPAFLGRHLKTLVADKNSYFRLKNWIFSGGLVENKRIELGELCQFIRGQRRFRKRRISKWWNVDTQCSINQ